MLRKNIKDIEGKALVLPTEPLVLKKVLKFYESNKSSDKMVYAEIKKVSEKTYRPLERDELHKLLKSFSGSAESIDYSGLSNNIPVELMKFDFIGFKDFTWYKKPETRYVHIHMSGLKSGTYEIKFPFLIFHATTDALKVTITGTDPRNNIVIYKPIMMNTSIDGDVCLGNQNIRRLNSFDSLRTFLDHWENIYFNSPFTHMSHSEWPFSKKFPVKVTDGLIKAWKYIIKEKKIETSWLIPTKAKLKS